MMSGQSVTVASNVPMPAAMAKAARVSMPTESAMGTSSMAHAQKGHSNETDPAYQQEQ